MARGHSGRYAALRVTGVAVRIRSMVHSTVASPTGTGSGTLWYPYRRHNGDASVRGPPFAGTVTCQRRCASAHACPSRWPPSLVAVPDLPNSGSGPRSGPVHWHIGASMAGHGPPVPVPGVPVPDLSGDGDGASVPDLAGPGDGDAPPSPIPIGGVRALVHALGDSDLWTVTLPRCAHRSAADIARPQFTFTPGQGP
jgi:hypothetical protein